VKLVKILLPIDQRGTTEACAKFAFGLAGRSGAALEVLHASPAPTDRLPYATELSPVYFAELVDVGKKQVELEQRQAHSWLATTARAFPNVRATFLHIEDPVAHTVAIRAKAADVTVLPSISSSQDPFFALARDAALFNSGRAMLVVPNETRGFNASTVVIAWKDTVEAVRALAASAPFLAAAKRVKLISIAELEDENETPTMMTDYLTQGGVNVELVSLARHGRDVAEVLIEAAVGEDTLLVMGAYGHWRWREQVLGGTTQYVLHHTKVPVLMSH
jgi:nucleotide-binding universal stress UspA family protein